MQEKMSWAATATQINFLEQALYTALTLKLSKKSKEKMQAENVQ